jgi:hypothetical protein
VKRNVRASHDCVGAKDSASDPELFLVTCQRSLATLFAEHDLSHLHAAGAISARGARQLARDAQLSRRRRAPLHEAFAPAALDAGAHLPALRTLDADAIEQRAALGRDREYARADMTSLA